MRQLFAGSFCQRTSSSMRTTHFSHRTDPLLLKEKIYAELECCAAKNIPRTISNIVEIMKLAAHAESFPPKPDEIHVQNGTLRIDGSFLAGRPEIVRSRFPVAYNPQAEKPVVWRRFLSDLLYPEDIPTFQEYIGYCFPEKCMIQQAKTLSTKQQ